LPRAQSREFWRRSQGNWRPRFGRAASRGAVAPQLLRTTGVGPEPLRISKPLFRHVFLIFWKSDASHLIFSKKSECPHALVLKTPVECMPLKNAHTPAQARLCNGAATSWPWKPLQPILKLEFCSTHHQNPRQLMTQSRLRCSQASSHHSRWCRPLWQWAEAGLQQLTFSKPRPTGEWRAVWAWAAAPGQDGAVGSAVTALPSSSYLCQLSQSGSQAATLADTTGPTPDGNELLQPKSTLLEVALALAVEQGM